MIRFPHVCLLASLLASLALADPPATTPPTAPTTRKAPNDTTPTLITLHYADADAKTVLNDLFSQVGMSWEFRAGAGGALPPVTMDVERQSYWEVVTKLNDMLGTHIRRTREGQMSVYAQSPGDVSGKGVRCFSGPFLLTAGRMHHNVHFTLPAEQSREFEVWVGFQFEPHLRVLSYGEVCDVEKAVDEAGHSLAAEKPAEAVLKAVRADTYSEFHVRLAPPPNAGQKIALLKGTAHVKVLDEAKVIEVPANATKATTDEYEGAQVTVRPLGRVGELHEVSMVVARGNLPVEKWRQLLPLLRLADLSLLDGSGMPLYDKSSGGGGGSDKEFSVAIGFVENEFSQRTGPPAKIVITIPTKVRDVPIPFEFKDLPLP